MKGDDSRGDSDEDQNCKASETATLRIVESFGNRASSWTEGGTATMFQRNGTEAEQANETTLRVER